MVRGSLNRLRGPLNPIMPRPRRSWDIVMKFYTALSDEAILPQIQNFVTGSRSLPVLQHGHFCVLQESNPKRWLERRTLLCLTGIKSKTVT